MLKSGLQFRDIGNKKLEITDIGEIVVTCKKENGDERKFDKDILQAYLNEYPERIIQ